MSRVAGLIGLALLAAAGCQSSSPAIDAAYLPGSDARAGSDAMVASDGALDGDAEAPVAEVWDVEIFGPFEPMWAQLYGLGAYGADVAVIASPEIRSYDSNGEQSDAGPWPWPWPWSQDPAVHRVGHTQAVRDTGELAILTSLDSPQSLEVLELNSALQEVRLTPAYDGHALFRGMVEHAGRLHVLVEKFARGLELRVVDGGSVVDTYVIQDGVPHVFSPYAMVSVGDSVVICLARADGPDDVYLELLRVDPVAKTNTAMTVSLYQDVEPYCELVPTSEGIAVLYSDYEYLHAGLLDAAEMTWIQAPATTHQVDGSTVPKQFVVAAGRLVGISAPSLFPITLPGLVGEPRRTFVLAGELSGGLDEGLTAVGDDLYVAVRVATGSGEVHLKRLVPW